MSKLEIIFVGSSKKTGPISKASSVKDSSLERKAQFERIYLNQAETMDPNHSALGRHRIAHTKHFLHQITFKKVADLGCGTGPFIPGLLKKNALVDAVDIASNALKIIEKNIKHPNLKLIQDCLPITKLKDSSYDLVISTETIADLKNNEYRLYFSELSRLINKEGRVICSTELDYMSLDSLQRFLKLAETEFRFLELHFSYHRLYLQLNKLLQMPSQYLQSWNKPSIRNQEGKKRKGFSQKIYLKMTQKPYIYLWKSFAPISNWLQNKLEHSPWLLNTLEKISQILYKEKGISHIIFLGRRKKIGE